MRYISLLLTLTFDIWHWPYSTCQAISSCSYPTCVHDRDFVRHPQQPST